METCHCFLFSMAVLLSCSKACLAAAATKTESGLATDQSALLAFRARITSDPHQRLAGNWSTATSVCSWSGVSCDPADQRVTALSLSDMGLVGTIPSQLANLSFLTSLDISNNSFQGHIPQELALLRRLQEINLGYNSFAGEVPSWFGGFPELQHLRLSNNSFTGTIPPSMYNISKLKTLVASHNSLQGNISEDIGSLSELKALDLSFNELTGLIPREIGNLTMLQLLDLGSNDLKGAIPWEIGNLKSLEALNFANGFLAGPIPSSIFNISSLRYINFNNNNLSGNLPANVHYNLPVLQALFLGGNQFTGQIPSNLGECGGLVSLVLQENKFTGSIPKKIGNLTSLKVLALDANNLTGTLPEEVANLDLELLNVAVNSLSGPIPPKLFNMSSIRRLGLSFNHFSGHLPPDIGLWLPNLEELHLVENELGGTIPSSISNASRLILIAMASNSFTGSIPNTLGNLQYLQRLFIGENNLTRESSTSELRFLTSLTKCRYLETLGIALNQFDGILPDSIGNLSSSLYVFEAFGAKIKGSIPSGIGNLSGLASITLDSNELTGPVPKTIGGAKNIERLYLEHNALEGHIPDDLCNLSNLEHLYVSDNKLNGTIPSCLGEIKTLRHIFLDSNNLTSTIPSNLWSLRDLLSLNLSTNSLEGNIPLAIGNFKVITQIDLSWNQLSGEIPDTIGGAQSLIFLSLAHNKLLGILPQSLGNLVSLEYLDLYSNNLSGVIPNSLENLRYLRHLNVSVNRLQGEIPVGGSFVNFTAQSFMQNAALCGAPTLQVPLCKTKIIQKSRSKILTLLLKYILPTIAAAVLVVVLIVCLLIRRGKPNVKLPVTADISAPEWRMFSYHQLLQATGAFNEINRLGAGSFGVVYKGLLSDGMYIAVKVFNLQLEGAFKSFEIECELMRNIRHRNLVGIISSCTNLDFKALILQYMPNGSLDRWLYSHNYCLDIFQRLNIMIDVASALEYLHFGLTTPAVHCDLKPSNVLLDEDMTAHVGDFGIAKLLGEGDFMAQTMTLATVGYMAPEYGNSGIVSTRCDVYSYGVMLMEIVTRKKPTDEMFVGEISLKSWVNEALDNSILTVVDTNMMGRDDEHFSAKEQCVLSMLSLALDCSNDSPEKRIHMQEALVRLNKIKNSFLANIGRT